MSFRHTHITEFLYLDNEDKEDVKEFINALSNEFQDIQPNWGLYGRLSWIVMFNRDSNGKDEELRWPERINNLSGILKSTVKIVSAWEGLEERQTVFVIPGRGETSREDYLSEQEKK